MPVLPWYRNQSIDLHSKSIDWFLYEGNTSICCVKTNYNDDFKIYFNSLNAKVAVMAI